jgi:hypothetical protein
MGYIVPVVNDGYDILDIYGLRGIKYNTSEQVQS